MLLNYLKTALRNLTKNVTFSFIHILGLTIGTGSCLLIFQYVLFETSYDAFHHNAENIYRVPIRYSKGFSTNPKTATNHPGLGPAMKSDFPEVITFTRILNPANIGVNLSWSAVNDQGHRNTFTENKIFLADSTFFDIFSFPIISGNRETMLDMPGNLVITEDMANKYFGANEAVGKSIFMNGRELKVTGVMKNVPSNSHLDFDGLMSFNTFFNNISQENSWIWPEFYTYVLLRPESDPASVEAKFPAFTERYMAAIHREHNFKTYFSLQPLLDIHLKTDCANEPTPPGSQRTVYFLTILAVLILIIAWVNYINLSTSRSLERAKEVGARKVAGAGKGQLTIQFLLESTLLNGISMLLGLILAKLMLPGFTNLVGKDIGDSLLNIGLLLHPLFWVVLIGSILAGGLIAGLYPALVLSSFKPSQILKGTYYKSSEGISLRKVLVGFQFVSSILLIAGTLLVIRQLSFINQKELGYEKDQVLVVKAPVVQDSLSFVRTGVLVNDLGQLPEVNSISRSSDVPGKLIDMRITTRLFEQDKEFNVTSFIHRLDPQFLPTYGIDLVAGRNFSTQDSSRIFGATNNKVLINETLASLYGFTEPEDAVGQMIKFKLGEPEHPAEVIGVISDYHQRSLREDYDPILYYYPTYGNWIYFSLNISSNDWSRTIAQIEEVYQQLFSSNALEYFFLDEYFDRQYKSEQQFSSVCKAVAGLAIFVTCLGIFGLSTLILARRTKEIGVRRVLGADLYHIVTLVSKDFVKIVIIANLIAIPIVIYFGRQWLNDFAFRIGLSWQIFVLPVVLLLLVILIIVGTQIYRSSVLNPVESLRSD